MKLLYVSQERSIWFSTFVCVRVCVCVWCYIVYIHACIHVCIYLHIYIHAYIHTQTRAHTHTCTHIDITLVRPECPTSPSRLRWPSLDRYSLACIIYTAFRDAPVVYLIFNNFVFWWYRYSLACFMYTAFRDAPVVHYIYIYLKYNIFICFLFYFIFWPC